MDKYKINFIFNNEKNINDIIIKTLNKELKKYIQSIYKNKKHKVTSPCMQFSLKNKGGKIDVT